MAMLPGGNICRRAGENATGALEVLVRPAALPPGNLAMYYPEANVLIPRTIDPASGTPVFKSTTARVLPL